MSIIDDIKDKAEDLMPLIGMGALWKGVKKVPSGAWWLLTKSPMLLRRGAQLAALYALTLIVEKVLDVLHEKFPDNELLAKADKGAHKVVDAENSVIGGATSLAKSAYDKVTGTKEEPKKETARANSDNIIPPLPPTPEPSNSKLENESLKVAQASIPPMAESELRDAAFMPVEPVQRSRANMNSELVPPIKSEPVKAKPSNPTQAAPVAAQVNGPDGMPINGGLDPKTGITWGPFMKSVLTRQKNDLTP